MTQRVKMGLPEELFSVMLEVGHCASHHKIPGPLAHTMIDIAQRSLELWRDDERIMVRFARKVLAGPTNLRVTTGQLPEPVASACWRLLGLLEYLASLDDGGKEAANQASDGSPTGRCPQQNLLCAGGVSGYYRSSFETTKRCSLEGEGPGVVI